MRSRRLIWMVLCLLCVAGAWLFWRLENRLAEKSAAPDHFSYTAPRPVLPGQLPAASQPVPARVRAALATNKFALRLSNTAKSIGELVNDPHAILLENALIDTGSPLNFSIPKHLQAPGDPGAYIVQARGPVTAAFRATLARAGAEIISYIPNDAYLVKVSAGGAGALADSPLTQSVIPYEPYYKIQSSLLNLAVGQKPLPDGAVLTLGLFADAAPQTIAAIPKLGGRILTYDRSPFGPVVRVVPPQNWTALAQLPGVGWVEPFHPRVHANDLSRVNTGVSVDTLVSSNYMNLTGSNVIVALSDSGVDATHPGFTTGGSLGAPGGAPIRVFGLTTNDLVDTDGHGTFVAGEIAGNGDMSTSPVNVGGILQSNNYGSVSNADFRGKAPLATLFAMNMNNSDQSLQEDAALTNALILNSSWNYDGDNTYNLAAASYDAATRDALPGVTGSQPVLFVFSAGNAGYGDDSNDPGGGNNDTIQSPATAKNVITVGAIQEQRDITNLVTMANGTTNPVWLAGTSTGYRVASYSSRGNVGIGIEGTYGRFKPDVVAPGTFIVSTRSSQFDVQKYFYVNPTNTDTATYDGVIADPDSLWVNGFPIVPNNAIGVSITVTANADSPNPFPTNLPIYFSLLGSPFPGSVFTANDQVNIPPDGGLGIADILNSETLYGFNYGISNITSEPISFDLTTTILTTNGVGNGELVLSNLDNTLGPYYRFETGTSMAAADVSGVLALMQDFFTNTLRATPSPALLKAMLINGARPTGLYNLQVNNSINFVGWGLVNLPNSLPTNNPAGFNGTTPSAIYFQDQSPTNALATGDSHTFLVTVQTNTPELRVTLVWTDPPGNPAAAIKLVNHLELVVTNMDNPTNPVVYYGNDIPAGYLFNTPENPTNLVVPDSINNVQNVIIPPFLGTNYAITVIGRDVNVNADSAQTNSYNNANPSGVFAPNVVQDYALVVSSVDGGVPGAFTVTDKGIVSNPTGDQDITFVTSTNQPYLNQFAGASSPLPGTNTVAIGADTVWGANGQVVLGETNQWHFYVVTNNGVVNSNGIIVAAPYAGFVTFLPPTLAVPRMGVFADTTANATRPQADIDLYVTTDPTLTNLNPAAVASCLNGTVAPGSVFNGVSLSRGGTEYVVDTNSTPGEVYYIGVKSEDQMAAEYDFFPVFSNIPFSTLDANGDETVNGVPVPVNIPDGTPANPGVNFVMGLAIYPINVGDITVTNEFTHQNFGDLYGTLTHDQSATGVETVDVLNNHDGWKSVTNQVFVYNETYIPSGTPPNTIFGPSDGPGSLESFFGQDGSGVWRLTEADDSLTQTGSVQNFTMFIRRHQPLTSGVTNAIPPHSMVYDFVDVPAGATNLTINATNITVSPDMANPLLMVLKFGSEPTLTDADKGPVPLTNGVAVGSVVNGVVGAGLGNSLSVGPTDVPPIQPGRYWVGITNQSDTMQTNTLIAVILPPNPVGTTADFAATGSTSLLDDAVTNADIFITNTMPVVSVNVGIEVQDPRISDLVFHLISPDGTRVLLMENRGGETTNGAGVTVVVTNVTLIPTNMTVLVTNVAVYSNNLEGLTATNYLAGQTVGGWTVTNNQVSLVTDPANAYQGSNFLALASGGISYTLPPPVTGGVYTLTFAYRGPGITAFWRGESNTLDSINGNNPTAVSNIQFTKGEVGRAFQYDGSSSLITMPASTSLTVSNLTIESWIFPTDSTLRPVVEWGGGAGQNSPMHLWVNTTGGSGSTPGGIHAIIRGSPGFEVDDSNPDILLNQWNHLVFTYNAVTRTGVLYANGIQVQTGTAPGSINAVSSFAPVNIGYRDVGTSEIDPGRRFLGNLDEVSVYNRPLSASEIKAIYAKGTNGKFDPIFFTTLPAQSLAEAKVCFNGTNAAAFYGNNTSWQIYTASGTIATNGTTLTIAGLEPGMLLDSLLLTNINITTNIVTSNLAVTKVVTNSLYLTFTEDTNLTTTPIKYAVPPFVPAITTPTNIFTNSFEGLTAAYYVTNQTVAGWTVVSNQVSLVTDPTNACDGSNYLALAGGTILTNLPTVAGQTYTLTFAYRGPGVVGWWRGESNANDSLGANNAVMVNGASFSSGKVGQAFQLNGVASPYSRPSNGPYVQAPYNNLWAFGANNFTIDLWANFSSLVSGSSVGYPYGGLMIADDQASGGNKKWLFAFANNSLEFHINGPTVNSGSGVFLVQAPFSPALNQWYHLAVTRTENLYTIYNNGVAIGSQTDFNVIPAPNMPLTIGQAEGFYFNGSLDEVSIYGRALSASEIKAIYAKGTNGKFDPIIFTTTPSQSLAEAQISLGGETPATILGNNTSWQIETITFTATQNGTPLSITGLEPGMLLDDFVLTAVPGNLYCLPEQSLDAFTGESAFGDWQLEIQDDRAGAGLTNSLVSWNLQFVFANTNAIPAVVGGGIGQMNQFIVPGGIAWYQVNVPANANYATNYLLFASAPVNVWFDTNSPPTTNILLLSGNSGPVSKLLSTTTAANLQPLPNIYEGQTYYLGVQNPNAVTVNYGLEVDFDHGNSTNSTLPALKFSGIAASGGGSGTTLKWTASPSAQFQMQWTDDLTQPWNTDSNVITSSDGDFTFTDDGSETAPLGASRFYRLVQISP